MSCIFTKVRVFFFSLKCRWQEIPWCDACSTKATWQENVTHFINSNIYISGQPTIYWLHLEKLRAFALTFLCGRTHLITAQQLGADFSQTPVLFIQSMSNKLRRTVSFWSQFAQRFAVSLAFHFFSESHILFCVLETDKWASLPLSPQMAGVLLVRFDTSTKKICGILIPWCCYKSIINQELPAVLIGSLFSLWHRRAAIEGKDCIVRWWPLKKKKKKTGCGAEMIWPSMSWHGLHMHNEVWKMKMRTWARCR